MSQDEKWMQIARKAMRKFEGKASSPDAFWWSMTIDRDDVLQVAMISAWKEWDKCEGKTPDIRSRNTYVAARSGIKAYLRDYLSQVGANEKLEKLVVGLDDEEVTTAKRRGPVNLTDVHDAKVVEKMLEEDVSARMQHKEEQARLRTLIEKAAKARLTRIEKRVLYMRYGIGMFEPLVPCEIAMELDITQNAVYAIIDRAEEKLKAELRAEEVFGD